jgi:hypothetical protein
VAELVDALDLGPSDFCFESSSLSIRNKILYLFNTFTLMYYQNSKDLMKNAQIGFYFTDFISKIVI